MKPGWGLAVAFLAWQGVAMAQNPVHYVTIRSQPPTQEMLIETSGGSEACPRVGERFAVQLASVPGQALINVVLKAPDHHRTVSMTTTVIDTDGTWPDPSEPPVALQPDGVGASVGDFFRYSPLRWLAWLVLPILGVGTPLALRWRTRARHADQRVREIQVEKEQLENTAFEGRTVGGYKILRKLGTGGMGAVYEATDNNTTVALKIIMTHGDEESIQRAQRELVAMASLTHPNIIRLYAEGQTADFIYLAMELAGGGTLEERLQPEGLPPAAVVEIMSPIMEAVGFAHSRGFMHRDLKPGNVMFTAPGQVKVLDFGLARKQQVSTKLTRTGTVLGTPAYISPEQITGQQLTPGCDQYSLGVMAWEMLAGRLPFDGEPMDMLMMHLNHPIPSLRAAKPALSAALEAVVTRMMAKEPGDRYPDLATALEALRSAL